MADIRKALVIGGGVGGNSTALLLARSGVHVDLFEADPAWRVYGAGLTMTGATLRAFRQLGMLDKIREHGALTEGLKLFDQTGKLISAMPGHLDDPDIPHSGGILRPVLHRLLCEEVRACGVNVQLGVVATSIENDGERVLVQSSDGREEAYDLVVGADGCFSATRKMLFPDSSEPKYTGQACWRLLAPRPADMVDAEFYLGKIKVGFVPCSPTEMYMFALENEPQKQRKRDEDLIENMRSVIAGFSGRVDKVREELGDHSSILYRPLEVLMMPLPWHQGRCVLIGDAVHSTTPHLASGAGIAVEDAIVLCDELARASSIEAGLTAFGQRRFERCRLVVENSVRLGAMEIAGADPREFGALMDASARLLVASI
ncbi:hypothetical protein IP81_16380 [Novosphingobium sp. AAP83]|uniref:FAD-dependent oxidoreductase n=1 Tax=Novosphingobium sp. AAP83 TaxID=1523425 RepID=UPI0006B99E8C|nr:FAD-dependent oxidoreductase [Novosphingobium sp. AAP83]KPF89750.1 hypothetical protein IP81_16380 [Novosphingobium sp. AAP83]